MARKELDRFETNYKKDIQIQTKLLALICAAVFVGCVSVCILSLQVFNSGFIEKTEQDLEVTGVGVENELINRSYSLLSHSAIVSEMDELKIAISKGYKARIQTLLDTVFKTTDSSFMFITDNKGRVVPGGGHGVQDGVDVSYIGVVSSALKGSDAVGIEGVANFDYAIIGASPIFHAGRIIGCVVSGYDLAEGKFVKAIEDNYGVEATIFKDDVRISSTLVDADGKSLIGTKLGNSFIEEVVLKDGNGFVGEVSIYEKDYYGYYFPILSGDNRITGMMFVAKDIESIDTIKSNTLKIVAPVSIILVIVLVLLSRLFVNWLMWRIKNVSSSLEEMATGEADLTKRCKLFIRDEIGFLVIHFDAFCDKMQQIVKGIKNSKDDLSVAGSEMTNSMNETSVVIGDIIENIDEIQNQISSQGKSVDRTASAVNEISNNIVSLNSMIESQSNDVAQASSAVEQMVGNIASVNTNVDRMVASFESLSSNAQIGFTKQKDVNERIMQIENQSQMLQQANVVISTIASQTNLLAMNAAIEAAHAGEAGKGFSVVADEIRKLSETSSLQSKTIKDQLAHIMNSISEVVDASNESGEALTAVSDRISETNEIVTMIKSAMTEQQTGSQQIISVLQNMNNSTVEVQNSSKEMASRNEKIISEIQNLQSVTENMKSGMEKMSNGASRISNVGSSLENLSEKVQDSIQKIGKEIDLFKV